jgi:hypothetical protein
MKQLKHLEQTLAIYVYSHCNIYNISIYFCSIHVKHLQHVYKTLKTYSYNTCFLAQHLLGFSEALEIRSASAWIDMLT